jgi:hypothetical protein
MATAGPKIIAKAVGDSVYLVRVTEELGYVADFDHAVRFPETSVNSLLARGGWEDAKHDDALLRQIEALPERGS